MSVVLSIKILDSAPEYFSATLALFISIYALQFPGANERGPAFDRERGFNLHSLDPLTYITVHPLFCNKLTIYTKQITAKALNWV